MLGSLSMKIAKFHFKGIPVLKSLPADDVSWIKANGRLKKIKTNVELFREGAFPKQVFILKKGKVKIFQTTAEGNEQIIYIYEPGDIFGYRPMLCNEKHPVSAKSIEDSVLLTIHRSKFEDLLERSDVLSKILLKNLSSEFSVWIHFITTFAQYSVKERLALCLLILKEKYKKSKQVTQVEINLTRKDLASFSGTSIETLARMLTKWKNEKIIITRGRKIIIRDSVRLAQLID
jgi:CRP-like cAMP-binding protein